MEGFDTITLSAGALEATFAPGLGMAGVSLRHAGEELLDRRAGLRAYARTGATMGLPLLYPWANRLGAPRFRFGDRDVELPGGPPLVHCEEHGLPIHGLLHATPHWRLAGRDADRVRARLDLAAHPELIAAYPFAHTVELDVALADDALTVTTTIQAAGDPVPIAFGFHPYLRLPGTPRASWEIALPPRRHLELDGRGIPTGAARRRPAMRLRLGARAFDDGYDELAPGAAFSATGGGRRLTVVLERGFPAAQVYTPSGAPFVCFEPMTAPTNALRSGAGLRRVAPGGAFTAAFSIRVKE